MKYVRLRLLLLTLWFILLYNLERPDFHAFGLENIDIESMVYVLAALVSTAILVFPELSRNTGLTFVPVILVYSLMKYFLGQRDGSHTQIYIIVTEITLLYLTVTITRRLSASLIEFENIAENLILAPTTVRIHSMAEAEEKVEHELFRARRFNREISFLVIQPNLVSRTQEMTSPFLTQTRERIAERFDRSKALEAQMMQHRIAKVAETMISKLDLMFWHNDDLVLCLPETGKATVIKLAENIRAQVRVRTDFDLRIGVATFPHDGLIYKDLVTTALYSPIDFSRSSWLDDILSTTVVHAEAAVPMSNGRVTTTNTMRSVNASSNGQRRFFRRNPEATTQEVSPFKFSVHDLRNPDLWINNVPYQSAASRLLYRIVKRVIDILLVLLLLPVAIPVMILIAVLIYFTDRGTVFFKQQRTGLGGRRFTMYKFRTMAVDAEEQLKTLATQGLAVLDKNGKLAEPLKLEVDPRVTRVGRILRKTSLDELPQVWNVLRGDMSIVGPRPTSWDVESYTLMQTERLNVRPGITGLWQVCDRGSTEFDAWLQWDMVYIDKMNFLLDIQIMLRTLAKVVRRSGAF